MTRARTLAVAAAAAAVAAFGLAGCPLPQPLPDTIRVDGGTITPPRIVVESAAPTGTSIRYGTTACPAGAQFQLRARLIDDKTDDTVEARWYVDYTSDLATRPIEVHFPQPSATDLTVRDVPTFVYTPEPGPAGTIHVVELVTSNGFAPPTDPLDAGAEIPSRTPLPGYETQLYRWVFVQDDGSSRCQ